MSEVFLIKDRRSKTLDLIYDHELAKREILRLDPEFKLGLRLVRRCGQDYMAGQICMRGPNHEGEHR